MVYWNLTKQILKIIEQNICECWFCNICTGFNAFYFGGKYDERKDEGQVQECKYGFYQEHGQGKGKGVI